MRSSATVAFTNTTTKVTPHTAVIPARGSKVRFPTWEMPRESHVKPPNGQAARVQSSSVQAAAIASASMIGLPDRRTRIETAPNAASAAADSNTMPVHASSPNNRTQYSEAP